MTHPADVDYRAQNAPDEATLTEMMESALFLAELAQGRGRRRVDAEGRGAPIAPQNGPPFKVWDVSRFHEALGVGAPAIPERDPRELPNFQEDIFTEALAKAETEREHTLPPADQLLIAASFEVIGQQVRRMRELPTAQSNPVFGHALNSIDLGLIGLAKVKGGE